jgi:hypothetical protein
VKTELFPKEFVLELNTKNVDNSTSFLTITHTTLSAKRFRKYRILMVDIAAVFYFWTEQRRNGSSIFQTQIGRNSGSLKYHFGRQLSPLPDGLRNGSKWLLKQYFWQIIPTCIEQVFCKISPWPFQKLRIQKMSPTNSAFRWLLLWLISTNSSVVTVFWNPALVSDTIWTDWTVGGRSGF